MRRNQDFYRSAEIFDPASGKFHPSEMLMARVGHVAVLLRSGKVLIAGGWIGHGVTNEAELYDPATGKFTEIAHMTTKRGRPEATLLQDGNVLITGGGSDSDGPGSTIVSAEVFDMATLKFRATGPMHHARIAHSATLLSDGRVLIAGGRGSEVNASAELYDPKTGTFRETGRMITARYKHTAGLLPDGRVLLAGGSDERDWHGTLSSAEIYDPSRETFSATTNLNDARFKLPSEAVRLPSGRLLVAGGNRLAEIYDERSGKFTVVGGDTGDARHYMSETLLRDGRVLLAGGYAYSPEATAQTWIYRP
jgi:Kelch motif